MNDIIVGIDRTATSSEVANVAARLAAAQGVNLHLVMCATKAQPVRFTVGADTFHTDWLGDAEQYLMSVAGTLRHDLITHTVGIGEPAVTLCEEAERLRASTIVVGNRAEAGRECLFGPISTHVTSRARCTVVVVTTGVDAGAAAR